VGLVETGYSFPSTSDEQREFSFTLSSDRMYAKSGPDRIEIRDRNNLAAGTRSLRIRIETDVYYPLFVKRVLDECRTGAKPLASLRDAEAMMQVMDAAYTSARQGGAPQNLVTTPERSALADRTRRTSLTQDIATKQLMGSIPIPLPARSARANAWHSWLISDTVVLKSCWFRGTSGQAWMVMRDAVTSSL